MKTNSTAYAKVVLNKRLNTLRLLVTFDVSKRNTKGDVIVTVQNCIFASGDLVSADSTPTAIASAVRVAVRQAQDELRTDNIQML